MQKDIRSIIQRSIVDKKDANEIIESIMSRINKKNDTIIKNLAQQSLDIESTELNVICDQDFRAKYDNSPFVMYDNIAPQILDILLSKIKNKDAISTICMVFFNDFFYKSEVR